MVSHQAHSHSVAVGAFRIFHLLGSERITLYRAALRALPNIVVNCLESLLEVLRRIKQLVVFLLVEFAHLCATHGAFQLIGRLLFL